MKLRELQRQQRQWAAENFGEDLTIEKAIAATVGVSEEFGELAEAIVDFDADRAADAVGDIVIYLADVCTRSRWDLDACQYQDESDYVTTIEAAFVEAAKWVGRLSHSRLKTLQGIRKNEDHERTGQVAVGSLIASLTMLCSVADLDFEQVVADTWTAVVQKRDWRPEREGSVGEK